MATANPAQLLLLADHIKLSLLERQRAVSLNLSPNSQDGQISRSLESLSSGIDALDAQLSQDPDESLQDQVSRLRAQYDDLSAQFSTTGGSSAGAATLSSPNNPALSADFAAATSQPARKKAVRFTDADDDDDVNRAALFPYRDDPDDEGSPDHSELSNQQIHDYHRQVIAQQDEQLDRLGESIGRQRELSIQIGDELDSHVMLLDEVDESVDRHQSQLDRAGKRLAKVGRRARENWSMTLIVVLIVILVLLIVITK
ncbi:putative snare complex subunit protein [Lasiodiplodia theobromae]|uniref:Putative syntaxin 6 n=1 Tax=Lasiodiplodia theobromae TaxID=45133 RepID=A0A5N5DB23_9PEZI|nr:Snare complex subunit [Lasiodiplodia theobromae]KAB2574998.1 putative syntaxin 6 [Lasiodiplodia theobromae]KAF4540537.1 Snare complex subunit [Lasiodiplodia theobromae]KAF9640263.1 putative snare complex subunit protein [Lasiodiplodia theobromae]